MRRTRLLCGIAAPIPESHFLAHKATHHLAASRLALFAALRGVDAVRRALLRSPRLGRSTGQGGTAGLPQHLKLATAQQGPRRGPAPPASALQPREGGGRGMGGAAQVGPGEASRPATAGSSPELDDPSPDRRQPKTPPSPPLQQLRGGGVATSAGVGRRGRRRRGGSGRLRRVNAPQQAVCCDV